MSATAQQTPQRRVLEFRSYDDMIADIRHLQRTGYVRLGKWDLSQMCDHLAYYVAGSLDGFKEKLPGFIGRWFGPILIRKVLTKKHMKSGLPTLSQSVFPTGGGEASVDHFVGLLERIRDHAGLLHPSPLFGPLTAEQWRDLHLVHGAHHLSFLVPNA